MTVELFVTGFGLVLAALLAWGFRALPGEKWQILCTVPSKKQEGGWAGINFTFYGLLNANSVTLSACLFFLLLTSVHITLPVLFTLLSVLLTVCVPASRLVAKLVEKKSSTLSVGGASFIGFLIAPWLVSGMSWLVAQQDGMPLPVLPVMAAISIAYAFGEGTGRLSCISFGCCYGKPLSQVHPLLQNLFRNRHFVFEGKTKKISYAGKAEGKQVVPVQALTATVCCTVGLAGLYLFLKGSFVAALLITMVTTQVWRFVSEFLRADHRGGGTLSAYQLMGLAMVAYAFFIAGTFSPSGMPFPALATGLKALWNPAVLIFLHALWVAIFFFTGRSRVTGASLSFHVVENNI